eukprot:308547-Rhodomonas_salina.3
MLEGVSFHRSFSKPGAQTQDILLRQKRAVRNILVQPCAVSGHKRAQRQVRHVLRHTALRCVGTDMLRQYRPSLGADRKRVCRTCCVDAHLHFADRCCRLQAGSGVSSGTRDDVVRLRGCRWEQRSSTHTHTPNPPTTTHTKTMAAATTDDTLSRAWSSAHLKLASNVAGRAVDLVPRKQRAVV